MPKYVYLADVDESGELIYSTSVPGKADVPRRRSASTKRRTSALSNDPHDY